MTFKELRHQSGMTQQQFSEYFGIPRRTIENWEAGVNKCNGYLIDLMIYKLNHEGITRANKQERRQK
jgi:DNA-binding transcriptional regulator YiaG